MNARQKNLEKLRLIAVFSMLGAIMFVSKLVMEFLPNVHLIGALTMVYTIVYRSKALIPLYIFVFLSGLYIAVYLGDVRSRYRKNRHQRCAYQA